MSPGVRSARTKASARHVSMTIRAFQPRVWASPEAIRLVRARASSPILEAPQVARVEVPRFTWRAQLQLRPCGRADWRKRFVGNDVVFVCQPGAAEAAHARQLQLPAAGVLKVFRSDPALACGGDAGLQSAQPAVPFS
jgi:hypothetical protein